MTVEVARRYSGHVRMIARGGFICGDHDYEDMVRMVADADAVDAQADKEFWLP